MKTLSILLFIASFAFLSLLSLVVVPSIQHLFNDQTWNWEYNFLAYKSDLPVTIISSMLMWCLTFRYVRSRFGNPFEYYEED